MALLHQGRAETICTTTLAMVMNIMMMLTRPYSAGLNQPGKDDGNHELDTLAPPFSNIFQNRPFQDLTLNLCL